jgi:hypothetical protein
VRRQPDPAQPLPDCGPPQIVQMDAEAATVGKGCVAFARAGEIRIDVDDAPHIADEDEGRAAMIVGEGAGVFHCLAPRRAHQVLPVTAGASAGPPPGYLASAPRRAGDVLGIAHPALLGFEHEGVAAVEIDPRRRAAATLAAADHGPLEDVVVALMGCVGGVWFRQVERAAQADQEELVIRTLLATLAPLPSGDEGLDGIV